MALVILRRIRLRVPARYNLALNTVPNVYKALVELLDILPGVNFFVP
jgi:hypothetical protein